MAESNRELFVTGSFAHFYSSQAHFTKIDSSGNVIFQNILVQTNNTISMCKTITGNYAIAGLWENTSADFLFLLLNNTGVVVSRKVFNSFGDELDGSSSIIETSDRGFLITGSTTYIPNLSGSNRNIYVVKTDSNGNSPVSINNISSEIPLSFKLYQNFPNPFNPFTNLEFQIPASQGKPKSGFVLLKIYDMIGKEIAIIVNDNLDPGTYRYEFDGSNFVSGVYFYELKVGDYTAVKRMVLIK